MEQEMWFRLALAVEFVPMYVVRKYYESVARKTTKAGIDLKKDRTIHTVLQSAILAVAVWGLLVYLINPRWMAWSALSIPLWLRWAGAALGALGTALLIWTHVTLRPNFFGAVQTRPDHQLVTNGPYQWIHHPMYTAFLTLGVSYLLLPANWFIGGVWLRGAAATIRSRLDKEEAMLVEKFGDIYQVYLSQTGRLLPRWRRPDPGAP